MTKHSSYDVSLLKRPRILGYRKNGAPIWSVQGAADEDPIERLEARNAELAEFMEKLLEETKVEGRSAEVRKQHDADWKAYEEELDKNAKQLDELRSAVSNREAREQKVREARSKWKGTQTKPSGPGDSELYDVDFRTVGSQAPGVHRSLIERSKRIMDDDTIGGHLEDHQRRQIEKLVRQSNSDTNGETIAALLIATSNPHYRSAFQKATSSITPVFTPEEGRAVNEVNWIRRAMSIGASASGGFAVPVVIDPTVILTAQGTSNKSLSAGFKRSW